jgi:hypothetical protein
VKKRKKYRTKEKIIFLLLIALDCLAPFSLAIRSRITKKKNKSITKKFRMKITSNTALLRGEKISKVRMKSVVL